VHLLQHGIVSLVASFSYMMYVMSIRGREIVGGY
jgi:hypothetical protein